METTLSAPITAVDLTMIVGTVTGLPVTFPYSLILDIDVAAREVVTVSAAAGTTLTIQRAQDGTAAGIHVAGAKVTHGVVARDVNEPQVHIAASTGVHGVGGSVVGTTGAQTLTGKSIDGSANTLTNVPMTAVTGNLDGARIFGNVNLSNGFFNTLTTSPSITQIGLQVNGTGARTAHLMDVNDAVKAKGLIFGDDGTTTLDNGDLYVDVRRAVGAAATVARMYSKNNATKPALVLDRPAANTVNLQEWRLNGVVTAKVDSNAVLTAPSAVTTGDVTVGGNLAVTGNNGRVNARKAADQTVNNSAALIADSALLWPVVAGGFYQLDLHLLYNSSATANFQMGWTFPVGLTMAWTLVGLAGGVSVAFPGTETVVPNVIDGAGTDRWINITGLVTVGGTPGTLTLTWAQKTATVGNTIMRAGSYGSLTRVP